MNKYRLATTNSFKKDYKKVKKRGYDLNLLDRIVSKLLTGEPLEGKHRDHALTGDWKGYRECHIMPDWLLVYEIHEDKLILTLTRTGTHSDLDLC
jgi:mRNA interferase YafQ